MVGDVVRWIEWTVVLLLPVWLPALAFWGFARMFGMRKAWIFAASTTLLLALDWVRISRWFVYYYQERHAAAASAGTLIGGWIETNLIVIGSIVAWAIVFLVWRWARRRAGRRGDPAQPSS